MQTETVPAIRWMDSREEYLAYERCLIGAVEQAQEVAAQQRHAGYCAVCVRETDFVVRTGAWFDGRPNLREGLRCPRCRMTARQRSLFLAILDTVATRTTRGAVLERFSPLYRALRRAYPDPNPIGSEFLSPRHRSGRHQLWHPPRRWWRARWVRHESVVDFSYADATLDWLVHTDVLEHVADTPRALSECRRVLRDGGAVVFTVPFFSSQETTRVRGYIDGDGRLVELLPGEYHGDGLDSRGIYTFYNFGWDFYAALARTFRRAQIGVLHDLRQGFLLADAQPGPFNMFPVVFRAYR